MGYAFNVDLRGIVDLLSHHLYASPRVYVRELLQNSVDAITARRSGAAGQIARRATIASTAFCNSSRTYTLGLLYRWWLSRSTTPRRSTWNTFSIAWER